MIGNDLVYLPEWPQRSGNRLQRFGRKVFTEAEREFITSTKNPHLAEAWLWSCKEAAYKVWFKTSHRREFAPKRFEVQGSKLKVKGFRFKVESLKLGLEASLWAFDRQYFLLSFLEADYIHTLASDQSFAEVQNAESWRGHFRPKSLKAGLIQLQKDQWGVPKGWQAGRQLDLSLSHDGGAVAVVWTG